MPVALPAGYDCRAVHYLGEGEAVSVENLKSGDPHQIGRYTVLGGLGSGEAGEVFLGRSPDKRLAAIMVFRKELAEDAKFRADFAAWVGVPREGSGDRLSQGIDVPQGIDAGYARWKQGVRRVPGYLVPPVTDAGPGAQPPWLAARYEDGLSLEAAVEKHGPLPLPWVTALATRLAKALAVRVHGDLKPSDVLLTRDGPELLAVDVPAELTAGVSPEADASEAAHFMSPERALGSKVTPESDIFSLGAVLTFAATGQKPYGTGTFKDIRWNILNGEPWLGKVPAELESLIRRCLAREPTDRPTAQQFLTALNKANPEAATWDTTLPEDWLHGILPPSGRDEEGIRGGPDWSWKDLMGIDSGQPPRVRAPWWQWREPPWLNLEEPPWWNWEKKQEEQKEKDRAPSTDRDQNDPIGKRKGLVRRHPIVTVTIGATATLSIAATLAYNLTVGASSHNSPAASAPSGSPSAASGQASSVPRAGQPAGLVVQLAPFPVTETITWSTPVGGTAPHEYEILQDGKQVGSTSAGITHYLVKGLTPGDRYRFTIVAVMPNQTAESTAVTVTAGGTC